MRTPGYEPELLRALASMPFLDRQEMVAVSGWSRGAVYEAVEGLESGGFCASVLHAADPLPPARRFHLTAAGLRRLAAEERLSLDELVRARPVSAQWRRSLMERLDAVAAIYRIASVVSNVAYPMRFRWYRAVPMDAAMTLPDGKTVGVVRQGLTADRSGFSKRLWRLRDGPMPGTVLILMADDVRLRHARRLLSTTDVPALLALERDAVLAGAGDPIWSPTRVRAGIDLRYELERAEPGGELPEEDEPQRASVPADFAIEGPGWDISDHMLPVMLSPAEKRTLDLVSDWPWISMKDLAGLLGVSDPRVTQLANPLEGLGLAVRPSDAGGRLVLTDRGLALLARRDRTSVGVARRRWSIALEDAEAPLEWRNVSGRRTRQLLRHVGHTNAVHLFLAALTAQARLLGWEIAQIDSPRRASRHFRHEDRMRAVNPDAFGLLRRGDTRWLFFLEWERRAVRPSTMSTRLAPIFATTHLTGPPTTTAHGPPSWSSSTTRSPRPISCAWRGRRSTGRGSTSPLWVSHREAIDVLGPPGARLARTRRLAVAPIPAAPVNDEPTELPCARRTPTYRKAPGGAEDGSLSGSTRRPSGSGSPF